MQRVILVVVCTLLFTGSMAQQRLLRTKFNCKASAGTASGLLHELVTYCGINIEYSPSSLDNSQQIALTAGETTIGAVLNKILKAQRVAVIERNDKIIIAAATTPLPPGALLPHVVLFGFVQQEGSLEPLPFASVREVSGSAGCESNIAGFYTMNMPAGLHRFEVSFTGFTTRIIEADIQQDTRFNLILSPAVLPEVQVSTGNILKGDAGNNLDKEQTGMYSNMLGETDPVRAVYLLPGNTESQETGGQLIVRGGEPGQSLFLLDGNPVFNPAHLLGEISIVNNTSIKSVKQYKNDFPSRFSSGISAITAIHTKDGNMERWTGEAEAGFSSVALTFEGPVTEKRTALMVSGRSSLGDAANKDLLAYDALFNDLHLKLTSQLNKNNKLSISGYTGNDRLQQTDDNSDYLQTWRNGLFTVNWDLVTGKRSFINTAFNISSFDNYVALKYNMTDPGTLPLYGTTVFNNYASGRRYEAKTTFEITADPGLKFLFGGNYEHVDIMPYTTLVTTGFVEDRSLYTPLPVLPVDNFSMWYENSLRIGNNLLLRPGVHVNAYTGKAYNNQSVQPRFFASYRLNNQQQLSIAYSHMGQVLHQVTSPYPGINREIWLPANSQFQPALSKMINFGYQYKNSRIVNLSLDIYYKTIEHVVNFSETTNVLFYNAAIEKKLIEGKGSGYGAELVMERKFKKWKTLLSYTLSWSWRQFDSVQNGAKQPYRYDRRHNSNWLISYQPDARFEISVLWHFHTGDWITIPALVPSNPEENMNKSTSTFTPYRGHVFNRVNINATCYFKPWKIFTHKLNAGVHIMDHPSDAYTTRFSTPNNTDYNIDLFPDQLFKYSWYIAYNISF
ncbi:hypothetical protein A3860_08310 [Niastella vici]|uniref:TonB-dependent receptor plug domain-containing protein n=1 Tax=Niastella vici TaxID=1703345 RepID=A0A1V9FGZ2_9BACT|nr:TonB-dependent receptor [Niastella vici]OQP57624.1 hypothetical protein A3860_08310 [Niastella vici]